MHKGLPRCWGMGSSCVDGGCVRPRASEPALLPLEPGTDLRCRLRLPDRLLVGLCAWLLVLFLFLPTVLLVGHPGCFPATLLSGGLPWAPARQTRSGPLLDCSYNLPGTSSWQCRSWGAKAGPKRVASPPLGARRRGRRRSGGGGDDHPGQRPPAWVAPGLLLFFPIFFFFLPLVRFCFFFVDIQPNFSGEVAYFLRTPV